jgi:lysozyme family protein
MASFAKFIPVLKTNEGGYANDSKDLGGETFIGIARKFWKSWRGWAIVDEIKKQYPKEFGTNWKLNRKFSIERLFVNAELIALVEEFYRVNFWSPMQLDLVANQSVANQIADHGINANTHRAEYLVQWVLRESFGHTPFTVPGETSPRLCADLGLDGQLGKQSLAALNTVDAAKFFARFRDVREEFYRYRAGKVVTAGPAAAAYQLRLHSFFRSKLDYWPGEDVPQNHFDSWLTRTNEIKFAA